MNHGFIEKNIGIMGFLIFVVISFGGLVQVVPLMFHATKVEPVAGLKPLTALQLEGRDIYMREGCSVCHTQMIRHLPGDVLRYGQPSVAGESVYNHPFMWGSKRTGPDLARVGGRYSDEWHRAHLFQPRDVVPVSNMPSFPWLFKKTVTFKQTAKKMEVLRILGVPYSDEDIAKTKEMDEVKEIDALVAYLQQLGSAMK